MFKLSFNNQCLLALVLGVLSGKFFSKSVIEFIVTFGNVFIQLLTFIVIPLTFSTIIVNLTKIGKITLNKSLIIKILLCFAITSLIAGLIGIVVGLNIIGKNEVVLKLNRLPNLINQISTGWVIPIIVSSIFLGLAITSLDKNENIIGFFSEFSEAMFKITRIILRLSPYGIFFVVLPIGHIYGFSILVLLIKFVLAIYSACFFQIVIYGLLIAFATKQSNPIIFFKQFWPAIITAYKTSSSMATLPVTIEVLQTRIGVSQTVTEFVETIGAKMKMDGCGAIYPVLVCMFTASILGMNLSIYQYVVIIITVAVINIVVSGIPGIASVMSIIVLSSIGLPLSGLVFIIGLDRIIDVMRTITNVIGCGVCATIVDSNHKKFVQYVE